MEKNEERYAIVDCDGRQYRVEEGDILLVNRLDAEPGETVVLDRVLAAEASGEVKIGSPCLEGVTVKARVISHERGKKILVFKFKRRKDYRRKRGHRQDLTRIRIESIEGI
ncbi:MAG: 50S ribosomal protein L21 [Candidatus Hydrogenedentota bacterium]|nr:MAG: 50S ribosomal protein L21 [Candidatus Hydrogenedentota bacterium]